MTNLDTDYDFDDDGNPVSPEENGLIRDLREKIKTANKERDDAKADAEKAVRKTVFQEAGIPAKAEFFRKHYDGPLDVEAIKAEAVEAGVLEPPPPDTEQSELDSHDAIENAAAGTAAAPGFTPAAGVGSAEYKAELAKCNSPAEQRAVMAKFGSPIAEG